MDIEAARRAGYSDTEIALELGRRTGRNAQGALDAGHSPLDVIADFEKSLVPSWSEVPGKAAESFFPSAARAAGDVANAFAHPIDTVTELGKTTLGGLRKVTDMLPDGMFPAGMPSMSGPMGEVLALAKNAPDEWQTREHADALGEYVSNRYGSMDNIKNTMGNDPVGLLSDLSALMTGGAGALRGVARAGSVAGKAGQVMGVAAKMSDPLTIPAMAAKKVGGGLSKFLPTPERLYQSALMPTISADPVKAAKAENAVRVGLEERILPTKRGLEDFQSLKKGLGEELSDLINARASMENAGAVPKAIDLEQIAKGALDYSRGRLQDSPQAIRLLPQAESAVFDFLDSHGAGNIDAAAAQKMKTRAQAESQKAFGEPLVRPRQEANKGLSHGLREALEGILPEIRPINQRLQNLHDLGPELGRAVARTNNWNMFSLPSAVNSGTGALIGGRGGGPWGAVTGGLFGNAVTNLGKLPGTKARIAFGLDSARNAANSDIAQLVQKAFSGAVGRPARAGAYTGARTDETFQEMMNRYGIKTSLDK